MILYPGCTLESHKAFFKKSKYTDLFSPNFDTIGLVEVKTKCHIFFLNHPKYLSHVIYLYVPYPYLFLILKPHAKMVPMSVE